ncbi:MAG: 16S rRNA (cytosine(1402)-N(4))-methyltransferase RsmH [Planctomycetes bacterium]|nr:16S rRNA (cytosine(1402)-N(4))-methyltransferase RsmH [Planctomycetota bacterium]
MSRPRSTPPGQHCPVLLDEVLACLHPKPGDVVVDATVGWAGHAVDLLKSVDPAGLLIGCDLDAANLEQACKRLTPLGLRFHLHHANFAGLAQIVAEHGVSSADVILADLGMSSLQVDDPERGFSYRRDGALDMRMDPSHGRTAAQLLATISENDLRRALEELADEPAARIIAAAIVTARQKKPIERTGELAKVIQEATGKTGWRLHPSKTKWTTHPAARTFQALRILVNREFANLEHFLRILPACLNPGGRAAIITFHSGEDRLVKSAFREGLRKGVYEETSPEPVRATFPERQRNPRARSAKLRWAKSP